MSKAKILVVDDEPKIVSTVRAYLERDGYEVVTAGDGKTSVEVFKRDKPDLIILDLMLPEIDGLEVCRTIRRASDVPIIMLTARQEDADKLIGLEIGADDYVTKPFSPRELVARVKVILRRAKPSPSAAASARIEAGGIVVDEDRFEATCHGQPIPLTATEFKILTALVRNAGLVLSRSKLLDLLGENYEGYERTIDVHVKNLRRKLGEANIESPCSITTVHGVGYKFQEPDHGNQ
ncbi:two-component system, OmpR family, alkaline phosphatase synthesis response regulator PhoP [Dehalogenimonas formicexedens]|uniref:Two-component system, OmpR family, alkaline phosphatase synthesis response regulator PhoP n=1 Tax=Dehalogenimonas formicexedens TaxID=1839801 RepID=A0A1P8F5R0_9CHLR|nr:response regulator transcription factor [Dehalogenimonas formicexedens]APV43813.1 two-component system, OmpR family, alkaline phosphatase synthesis response regulator PhoP [Dehalogenimonas formicexedens]